MALVLLGLSHKSAPVTVREKLAIQAATLPETLQELAATEGIRECYILSTCNRVEFVARIDDSAAKQGGNGVRTPDVLDRFAQQRFALSWEDLERHTYRLRDRQAVGHLFRVACGLDSMVVGEPQILGQAKEAYNTARKAGTMGPFLEQLMQKTFAVAKQVRTETGVGRNPVSVAYAAVEMAHQIFGDLSGRTILLLGVGKMSELAARHLVGQGVSKVHVASRHLSHAVAMAEKFGGIAVEFGDFESSLVTVDIVISATAAPHPVIRKDAVEKLMRSRRNRSLFLIDIAVPRDVEPEVNEIDNVYLYNIDDLQSVVETNRQARRKESQSAEAVIERECEAFLRRLQGSQAAPAISALVAHVERIRAEEVKRMSSRLGPLTAKQEEMIETLTRGLVNKILHRPIQEIRRSAEATGDPHAIELLQRLFDIESAASEPPAPVMGGDPEASNSAATPHGGTHVNGERNS